MPKEAIELLLFFVLLFKSGFQSSDYCWNTDSGKLEVNNRKPRKYCLKGFYKGINSKSKRSDTASLTWSVLLPSYKAQGRKFWQDIWRFSRGHQKIKLHTISFHTLPTQTTFRGNAELPVDEGRKCFALFFFNFYKL